MDLYELRTVIVPDSMIAQVRGLVVLIAGEGQAGFCPRKVLQGSSTWWLSSGPIEAPMVPLIEDPAAMHAACVEAGAPVTLAQCQTLLAACIVDPRTGDDLPALLAEHGMQYAPDEVQ